MSPRIALAVVLGALVALSGLARSGEIVEVSRCAVGAHGEPASSAEAALKECGQLIASRRYAAADLASLYVQRGQIYLAMRKANLAISDFSSAIKLAPDLIDAYRGRAEAHFLNRDFKSAAADHTRAIALKPNDAWLLYGRAQLYYHANDCQRAIQDYSSAIKLEPSTAQIYAQRALCYGITGDRALQLADYERAAELEPDSFAHASRVCDLMLRVRSAEETVGKCSAVIACRPNAASAFGMRGLAYVKLGKFREAIADFDAALVLIASDPIALFGRGVAKLRSGDEAGGRADIAAATRVNAHIAETVGEYGVAP
jgi:tetratricopeptide (TPR) repeat protein